MSDKLSIMGEAKKTILAEMGNETTQKELVATIFKKFDVATMKRAVLEGFLRGFDFKDFLEKNVYAIKFGDGYTLVTSVDYARKRGMKGGIVGTEAPVYKTTEGVMKVDEKDTEMAKIISCSVTVKKQFEGGYVGDFTAEVYFDEYYKAGKTWDGKYSPSMWDTKPRTMIAKVAEMHALRKACPDELSQAYVEEEMNSITEVEVIEEEKTDEEEIKKTVKKLKSFKKLESLQEYYIKVPKAIKLEQEVIDTYNERKTKLQDN